MANSQTFAGIDVGGQRKGFDVAVIDAHGTLLRVGRQLTSEQACELVRPFAPLIVAIDSPRSAAPPGASARAGELAAAVRALAIATPAGI